MATTHEVLTRDITRNVKVVDEVQKLARYLTQRGLANTSVLTANYTGPATTTLAPVAALTVTNSVGYNGGQAIVGGRTYEFSAYIPCTVNAAAGIQITCNGGTATFSTFSAAGIAVTAGASASVVTTAASTPVVNSATAFILLEVQGTMIASSSGSFGLQVACNTAGTAPILLAGATLAVQEIAQ